MLTDIGNGIKMGIRGAVDYETEIIKGEPCYVQHIGVGLCNIVKKEMKKKTNRKNDKYINIDPDCHRMIHIPHENMDLVQFEFLAQRSEQHSIRIMLSSSDNHDHKKLQSKVIYEYNPSPSPTASMKLSGSIPPPIQSSQMNYDQHVMNILGLLLYNLIQYPTNDNKNVIMNSEAITAITNFMQIAQIKTMDNKQRILDLRKKIANLELLNNILLCNTQTMNGNRNNRKRLRESEESINNVWNSNPKPKRARIDPQSIQQNAVYDDSNLNGDLFDAEIKTE